jgi:hypothetical protein
MVHLGRAQKVTIAAYLKLGLLSQRLFGRMRGNLIKSFQNSLPFVW